MNIIYVLIPIAILLVSIAVAVFFWAVKSNQFEDLERHGSSILFDDDVADKNKQLDDQDKPRPVVSKHKIDE